jgi:hypothetical protein
MNLCTDCNNNVLEIIKSIVKIQILVPLPLPPLLLAVAVDCSGADMGVLGQTDVTIV